MRILIIGFVVFVIWSFFSTWLYVSKLLPALNEPIAVQTIPEPQTNEADSLSQPDLSPPDELMIYFDFDKTKLKTDPQIDISISEMKKWCEEYKSSILSVTGHADQIGTNDYNYSLGLRRAMAVKNYLEAGGIPPTKIVTASKGEEEPVGNPQTDEGRAENRRAELSIKMK